MNPEMEVRRSGEPRVARLFGIDVRLHWSFFLIVALFAVDGLQFGPRGVIDAVGWIVLLFGSVLFHEFAHALVGRARGARIKDILLLPLGGATRTLRFPQRPLDEFVMTVVGPLSSFALGAAAGLLGVATGADFLPIDLHHGSLFARTFWLNAMLGAFNLLPAFPMDGGRIVRAVLTPRLGRVGATRLAAILGRVVAVGLGIFGFYENPWLLFIGIFIFVAAGSEEQLVRVEEGAAGHLVREAMIYSAVVVSSTTSINDSLFEAASMGRDEIVVSDGFRHGIALVRDLEGRAAERPDLPVGALTRFNLTSLAPEDPLDRALVALAESESPALPVLAEGVPVGVVTSLSVVRAATFARREGWGKISGPNRDHTVSRP